MTSRVRPRFGSLQYWPRKRAKKALPSVNWRAVKDTDSTLKGFIAYKAGMASAIVRDETQHSLTKGKNIAIPVTVLEVPKFRIYSVRFYKNGKVVKDIVVSNDKVLKKKVKVAKNVKPELKTDFEYDNVRIIVYPVMKDMFKKTTELAEIAVGGDNKLETIKGLIGKEISFSEVFKDQLVDVRGLTRGKGHSGPVKRFGITLKRHKSEKGRRNPGSLGPWHPARVTFRVPMAGQLGNFTRVHYNLRVIDTGNAKEKTKIAEKEFRNYGFVGGDYIVLAGSVQGPVKRQILITSPLRANKKQTKKVYELTEIKR